jgi:hypothetical protein
MQDMFEFAHLNIRFYESREFLDQLSNYQLFKEETVPWSLFSFIININRQLSHWNGWLWYMFPSASRSTRLHGVQSQKKIILIITDVRTSNFNKIICYNTTTAVDNTASYSGGPDFIFLFGD